MNTQIVDQFSDTAARSEPYDFYAELRNEASIFYSSFLGAHVITRFEDARYVLDHPEIFSSKPAADQTKQMAKFSSRFRAMYEEAGVPAPMPTLVVTDGSEHRRYRTIVDAAFSVGAVRRMDAMVVDIVDGLIATFIDKGEVELYRDFCLIVPLYVICDILGLPRSGAPVMQRGGEASIRLAAGAAESEEQLQAAHRDIIALIRYLQPFIVAARKDRPDNLLGHLVNEPTIDGDYLNETELLSILQTLNVGGNETTTNGLGNMFEKLLNDAAMQETLRADRSLIPRFIEEVIRLESPVGGMPRWALTDAEVGGVPIPAGSSLHVRFGAANRDGRRFEQPDAVDLQRKGLRNHIGFGSGLHYCLGATLARFEMKTALERMFDRTDAIWIDPSKGAVRYGSKLQVRALTGLSVKFEKAAA